MTRLLTGTESGCGYPFAATRREHEGTGCRDKGSKEKKSKRVVLRHSRIVKGARTVKKKGSHL